MTFSQFEVSPESSRPVELYKFELGAETLRYVSSERDVTVLGNIFHAEAISRGKVSQASEAQDSILEIEVPSTNDLVQRFLARVPGSRCLLTLQRVQIADFPTPEIITLFQGHVQSVVFENNGATAKIAVAPIAIALSRTIPRYSYQSSCNNFLYDDSCQVDPLSPTLRLDSAIVTGASGNVITVSGASSFTDGWFNAGFVEALGGADARTVIKHIGNNITLLMPFSFNIVGQLVTLRAGCGHTIVDCGSAKFNNVINYGGFAFVPNKDLFQTGFD